jgi:hypothetical protein
MKKCLSVMIYIITASLVLASNVFSQEPPAIVIFSGLPIKKDMSDIEGTEQVHLSKSEQWNYRLEIIKRGIKYYWASRENRELLFSKSGEFYNFVEPNAAGYVRIAKTEKGVIYMEHLTIGMKNISYWGIATEHNLQ